MEEVKQGTYEHFKGKKYFVLGTATHSETLEQFVVYKQLYGNKSVWIRPIKLFIETVTRDGKTMPRFRFVSEMEEP